MSFDDFIRVGQIGTVVILTVVEIVDGVKTVVDLTTSSDVKIEIQKPDGSRTLYDADISNPTGTDGLINYTDNVGIFDTAGRWQVRGIVYYPSGSVFLGSWTGFTVAE